MTPPRTIAALGEAGLLEAIRPLLDEQSRGILLPSGDDVAITAAPEPGYRLVWTADAMIEGTHFRWWRPDMAESLGRKLAESNLSDLASKGARPRHALLCIGMPPETPVARVTAFFHGLCASLGAAGARLIGGDTVRAPHWSLALTLVGLLDVTLPIASRSRVAPGQRLYLTGCPGESAAGLELLEGLRKAGTAVTEELVRRHLAPTARLAEGAALVAALDDIAMIDVSDGVAHEASILSSRSGVRLVIDESSLPVSPNLSEYARQTGQDPLDLVLYGGEDYELLFATSRPPDEVGAILGQRGIATPVACIGTAEVGTGCVLRSASYGSTRPLNPAGGYEHFGGEE